MLLLAGNVRPSTPAPWGRRDLLTTEVGPAASGSKPGKEGCDQMPEKSGMAAGPAAGRAVCPNAGVAAAAANIASKPKFHCLCMTVSLSWLVGAKEMACASAAKAAPTQFWSFDWLSPIGVVHAGWIENHLCQRITKMTDDHPWGGEAA